MDEALAVAADLGVRARVVEVDEDRGDLRLVPRGDALSEAPQGAARIAAVGIGESGDQRVDHQLVLVGEGREAEVDRVVARLGIVGERRQNPTFPNYTHTRTDNSVADLVETQGNRILSK